MKRTCILIWVLVLGLAAGAAAHQFHLEKLTCPICDTRFEAASLGTYSTSGETDEGRPRSYFNVSECMVFDCPHCHYAGQLPVFKIKDNKYYTLDLPNTEQRTAIKAALAKNKGLCSGKLLYTTERLIIAEKCLQLRKAKPQAVLDMSLMCAWTCDDAGEDALAMKYRKTALAACTESLKDKTLTYAQRIWRRKLYWVLTSNIGKSNEALRGLAELLAETKQKTEVARKALPPKPKGYDEADGEMPYKLQDVDEDEGSGLFDTGDAPEPDPPMDPKTKAKLQKIWRAWLDFNKLQNVSSAVKREMIWVRYRTLDPAAAVKIAREGDYLHRYAFIDVHKSIETPDVMAAIKAFLARPIGKRPKSADRQEFKKRQRDHQKDIVRLLLRGDDTSDRLREHAITVGEKVGYFILGEPPFSRAAVENTYRRLPTEKLEGLLASAWKNVDKTGPAVYWDIPYGVLTELARRSDKDAVAALTNDFEQHLIWYTEGIPVFILPRWFPEHGEMPSADYSWRYPHRTSEHYWPIYKKIARNPKLVTAMARRLIDKIKNGKIKGAAAVTGLMPLGFIKTKESSDLLAQAAQLKDPSAAFSAAKCLLMRNDPAGKSTLITVILTHHRWDLPSGQAGENFINMLEPKDAAILPSLKKTYLEGPEYIKRHNSLDTYNEEGRGWPICLIAALAKIDKKQVNVYEAFIAELGKPERRPGNGDWSKTTGGYNAEALIEASEIHYRPSVGKQLAAALEHIGDERMASRLIYALVEARAADSVGALAKQLHRPTPLAVKAQIIEASSKVDIPGLPKKLMDWSKSRNIQLAKLAKTALARGKKAQK